MSGTLLYSFIIRIGSYLNKIMKSSIIKQLKERGLKITPQRLAVIEVLIEEKDLHPGARLVYEEAKKKKKSLSLSTTYTTLNELSRHGIIKTLQFDEMENRYEMNLEEHINLICNGCKKILDYKVPITIDQEETTKKTGFSVTGTRLEYYGYCRECRENKGIKGGP
ncbi:MAG: transcriptional repressor [Syntrophus sp. (in: bacteria)]|nr:transcriptional repressor [Syntrophus sp. (in: bacteria)]